MRPPDHQPHDAIDEWNAFVTANQRNDALTKVLIGITVFIFLAFAGLFLAACAAGVVWLWSTIA